MPTIKSRFAPTQSLTWWQRRWSECAYLIFAIFAPPLTVIVRMVSPLERHHVEEVAISLDLRLSSWILAGKEGLTIRRPEEWSGTRFSFTQRIVRWGSALVIFSLALLWLSLVWYFLRTVFLSRLKMGYSALVDSQSAVIITVFMICLLITGICIWAVAHIRARMMLAFQANNPHPADCIRAVRDSRRAIVDAFEIERKRISRDLHDGAQQYLVAAMMKLGEAQMLQQMAAKVNDADETVLTELRQLINSIQPLLADAESAANSALTALRRTVSGLAPQMLEDLGLEQAIRELITNHPAQIQLHIPQPLPPLPDGISTTAYFLIAEAITNAAKHAPAAPVSLLVVVGSDLRISVVDQGSGGAKIVPGHGLAGLGERLAAFGGTLQVSSPLGGPTTVSAVIPLPLHEGETGLAGKRSH